MFLLVLYAITIVTTCITLLMENRQPTKTLAWLMMLIFLPIVGFILYFFFGENSRKDRSISKKSLDKLTKQTMFEYNEQQNLTLPPQHSRLIYLFQQQNMAFPFKDNNIEVYTSGYQFFLSLLKEIGQSTQHIHILSYIFEDDALGNLIADALIDKAKQGVKVRVIYDDVGCWKVKNAFWTRMEQAGVMIYAFMPVRFPALSRKINYRNHRKLCIIDGKTSFIGGMNIALRYIKGTPKRAWRDTHLRITGGAVHGIQRAFLIDWHFVSGELLNDNSLYPTLSHTINNNCVAQVVTSSPIAAYPDIMQGYIRVLLEAKKYVYIETPYFLPTEPFMSALRIASLSGVDVQLIIPLKTDSKIVHRASLSYMEEALHSGIKVFCYTAGFNHSKLLVCDDSLCSVGSTNIDFRSFENNFESNIFIYSEQYAKKMKEIFELDLQQSVPFECVKKSRRYSFIAHLWQGIVRLLSPLL